MLCNTALMPLRPEQQELNQELRDYFELIDQVKYTLPMEALTAALAQDFPEYSNSNLSSAEILESLGIAHYYRTSIALNHQLMLCSITDSIEDAQALLKKYQHNLSDYEWKYFARALKEPHRTPQFYGPPKVHKTPWKLRPVTITVGSTLYWLSKCVDVKLQ